jgi:hypothetical protein
MSVKTTRKPARNRNRRKTAETRRIERVLAAVFPDAKIDAYRYNSASIRVRVIDPGFARRSLIERERMVLPHLQTLPEDTLAEIMILLLLTPKETRDSMMNLEFERPTPSRL